LDIFDYLNSFSAALFVKMENRSPKEQLRDTIEMTFHYLETQAQLVRFMTASALQPDAMSIPSQRFQTMKEHSIKTYVQLFSNLGYDQAETEAYFLEAALDGTALGKLVLQDRYPLALIKAKLINHYQL
jgi:hypothetical protein